MIEGEVRVKFKLNPVKASHYFLLPTTSSKEVLTLPRWQLAWNVGDMVVAQKCKPFYEWCEGHQVEIQSVTGIGTIDDERYANKFCLK